MTDPPSHRLRRGDGVPTAEMPAVGERRGRHSADEPGVLSSIWFAVAGAAAAVLLGSVVAFVVFGGNDDPGTPIVIGTAAPSDEALLPTDTVPSESPSPSPDASPSSSRSAPRTPDPAVLLSRLRSTVNRLAAGKQLDRNSAKELSRRVRAAEAALADGDRARAWNEVSGFADRLAVLRDQDRISSAGYRDLTAIVSQLAQVLPRG